MEKMGVPQPKDIEEKERPKVLYVSAQTAGIKELTPMHGRSRDSSEGSVIFSTPDKALASVFLVEGHDDSWMQIGYYSDIPCVVVCMDKNEFIKRDKGGTMYEVPSENFNYNPNLGMGDKEWTSKIATKPTKETFYPSTLDAMVENGVNVYFVDKKTFSEINNADDNGFEILLSLASENRTRNKIVKPLEDLVK
jgi:hypothetical protein